MDYYFWGTVSLALLVVLVGVLIAMLTEDVHKSPRATASLKRSVRARGSTR